MRQCFFRQTDEKLNLTYMQNKISRPRKRWSSCFFAVDRWKLKSQISVKIKFYVRDKNNESLFFFDRAIKT